MEPIQGHTGCVRSVAFSPNGSRIASGSDDNTIRVWDTRTGKAIMDPIRGHTDWVSSVMFSPDGACIVSGSTDETVHMWDVRAGKAVITANNLGPSTLDLTTSAITLPHAEDSWIRGPNQELIMWVPPEYHCYLQLPPCFMVIASARVVVDMTRFAHGTDWVKCCTMG
ncbi:WD40-repeat-containing domain protein [Mycena olivaceomarginata]|nr:WD40-repeat-containing domain protein [Mycena olivaceomarginata]